MKNFQTSFFVEQTPQEVLDAINNVPAWWGNIEGRSEKAGDEFIYQHGDMHTSKQRITTSVPGKKVTWKIVDSQLNFVADKAEWNGHIITFDIETQGDQTKLTFTQQGLTPELECYSACSGAWTCYVNDSLYKLITIGKGEPDNN